MIHHPNIIRLLDHLENNENIYIVIEYISGDNFEQYLTKNLFKFDEAHIANIMTQIASGVKYLHHYGIIHRDLKPANIMINKQNDSIKIKIIDFGLSKIISPNEKINDRSGTAPFSPPELFLGIPHNKKRDIWSLGVILYYSLSRILPFRAKTEKEIAQQIIDEEIKFEIELWENRSQIVQELIKLCLDKSFERRINIDDFINHPWMKKYRTYKKNE